MTSAYSVQKEAARIFRENLLNDNRLRLPAKVLEIADKTTFDASTVSEPYIPTPLKLTESSAALWALAATYANAITKERFCLEQGVSVNTDLASLFLVSALLVQVDGKALKESEVVPRYLKYDIGHITPRWRFNCTNVYPTKDGRWFHLHGSLKSDKSLSMLKLPQYRPELTDDMEIINEYCKVVSQYDSHWLDIQSNEHLRQAGTICLTPEEFHESEQGKAIANDPIYLIEQSDQDVLPPVPYSPVTNTTFRPLEGIKILDLSRAVAAPTIGKLAALYGATVVRVSCATEPELGLVLVDLNLGKRDTSINLKTQDGREKFSALLEDADVVLDGYRPGALEKLGFGFRYLREVAKRRQKGIILLRENCYGWKGPEAHRSGWQQISDCFTGVSWATGKFLGLNEPVVPPLPNSDYQTGIIGLTALLAAVDQRAHKGGSYLVSVSLNQYNQFLLSLGEYSPDVKASIRSKHPGINLRHYDTIFIAVEKLVNSLQKSVPDLFKPSYWANIESNYGKENGELETLTYVREATAFEQTKLGYDVGSCYPGAYEALWP